MHVSWKNVNDRYKFLRLVSRLSLSISTVTVVGSCAARRLARPHDVSPLSVPQFVVVYSTYVVLRRANPLPVER